MGKYTSELLRLSSDSLSLKSVPIKLAIHTPCTLQHGQKLPDLIEPFFQSDYIDLQKSIDSHLCCGSAGAYSIMQPDISSALTDEKLRALNMNNPDLILTANIGCQLTLQGGSTTKVQHWVEYLAELIAQKKR